MKKITKIIIVVLILGGLAGGYFGIRYEMKLYNTIVMQNKKIGIMDDFLSKTFPNEVQSYLSSIQAKVQSSVILPVNPIQK